MLHVNLSKSSTGTKNINASLVNSSYSLVPDRADEVQGFYFLAGKIDHQFPIHMIQCF